MITAYRAARPGRWRLAYLISARIDAWWAARRRAKAGAA